MKLNIIAHHQYLDIPKIFKTLVSRMELIFFLYPPLPPMIIAHLVNSTTLRGYFSLDAQEYT